MFTTFNISNISQKHLFYKLKNAFHTTEIEELVEASKISGVYAIFKDDKCYYVGQSKNLPSRLATHIKGKYSFADKIIVFTTLSNGFADFNSLDSESQKLILENNETRLIQFLKPIDNIIVNYDKEIGNEKVFDILIDYIELENEKVEQDYCVDFTIQIEKHNIYISDDSDPTCLEPCDMFQSLIEYHVSFAKFMQERKS